MKKGDRKDLKDLAVELVEAIREKKHRKVMSLQQKVVKIMSTYQVGKRRDVVKVFNKYIHDYVTDSRNI